MAAWFFFRGSAEGGTKPEVKRGGAGGSGVVKEEKGDGDGDKTTLEEE